MCLIFCFRLRWCVRPWHIRYHACTSKTSPTQIAIYALWCVAAPFSPFLHDLTASLTNKSICWAIPLSSSSRVHPWRTTIWWISLTSGRKTNNYRACIKPVVAPPLCANSKHPHQKTHKHTIFIEIDQQLSI